MSSTNRILIGAIGTALLSGVVAWHFGLCEKCAAGNTAAATGAVVAPTEASASVEAVASCQSKVDTVTKGKVINFNSGGAAISEASLAEVKAIADAVRECQGTVMEIAGHTDITGSDTSNQALSQSRADSVMKTLTDMGVPAARLSAKGYGETQPVVAGSSAAANAQNRRTEFHLQSAGAAPVAPSN